MRVRAKKLGYHNLKRRYPGDVFNLRNGGVFDKSWMENLDEEIEEIEKKSKPKKAKAEAEDESVSVGDQDVI